MGLVVGLPVGLDEGVSVGLPVGVSEGLLENDSVGDPVDVSSVGDIVPLRAIIRLLSSWTNSFTVVTFRFSLSTATSASTVMKGLRYWG